LQSGETFMELHALRKHGWSVSALAREFGLSRATVRKELRSPGPRTYQREKPTALTPAQLAHVTRRLDGFPGIRGTVVYEELREVYSYLGSYSAFARHLRQHRPPQVRDAEIRFETRPGEQTQADWAQLGVWPLGDSLAELSAMVTILGCSRVPAIRFATDRTRPTTLAKLVLCLDDLGGATWEILTDRDPAFVVGSTGDGRAILAPEWVDLCATLNVVPKACRPYRAKTKGKVERMVRELKEGFVGWLSGQLMPPHPTLEDYDALAARWIHEVVLKRRHRTTMQVVGAAWAAERPNLRPIPARILAATAGEALRAPLPAVVDLTARLAGDVVELRDLNDYEVAL
jgi:transposase